MLLAVAALSARMLAEAARDGGYRSVALDLFGDADTRRAADEWSPIGAASPLAIDGDALLAALRRLRGQGAAGWIAGSGFEAQPQLLADGAGILPLIGNPPAVVARVRDPAGFFARLAALGIPHPETRCECPPSPLGWLRKDFASSGGREVTPAPRERPDPADAAVTKRAPDAAIHYQRVAPGVPMSALFLADGRRSRLVGVHRQVVRGFDGRPYVFRGCIGPMQLPPGSRRALEHMLATLTAEFGVRGLNGLDFLLDGERLAVLELNPRPPASIALYRDAWPGGILRAHVVACLEGRLPDVTDRTCGERTSSPADRCPPTLADGSTPALRGFEVVFARRPCTVSVAAADAFARLDGCHDLPAAGTRFAPGEPLCTVSAAGTTLADVQAQLLQRRRQIPSLLEQPDEGSSEGLRVRKLECQ